MSSEISIPYKYVETMFCFSTWDGESFHNILRTITPVENLSTLSSARISFVFKDFSVFPTVILHKVSPLFPQDIHKVWIIYVNRFLWIFLWKMFVSRFFSAKSLL